jgi:hypothetical protein
MACVKPVGFVARALANGGIERKGFGRFRGTVATWGGLNSLCEVKSPRVTAATMRGALGALYTPKAPRVPPRHLEPTPSMPQLTFAGVAVTPADASAA